MLRIVLVSIACLILLGLLLGAGLRLLGRKPLEPAQRLDLSQTAIAGAAIHSGAALPDGDMLVVESCNVWLAQPDGKPCMMISSGDMLPLVAIGPGGEIALVRGSLRLPVDKPSPPGRLEFFKPGGTLLSSQLISEPVFSDNLASSGDCFAFGQGRQMRCFDFAGNERWQLSMQGTAMLAPQATQDGSFICADNAGGLSAVSAAGELLWRVDCPGALWNPQVCEDWIALRSRDRLMAFDLQGRQLFSQALAAESRMSLLLPLPQGLLCYDWQRLTVLDREGRSRVLARIGPGSGARAMLDSAGRLYVAQYSQQTRMEKLSDDLRVYGGKNRTRPGEGLELYAFDQQLKTLGRFEAGEHGGQLIRMPDGAVAIGIADTLLVFGD